MLMAGAQASAAEVVRVGEFSQGSLAAWEEKSFAGQTRYELRESASGKYLHASTQGAASGLFKKIKVDLAQTPYLNWSWRVEDVYRGNDERAKPGDDYPARVYVVVSGGVLFWNTRAINYVWSSNQAIGSAWPNAYTDHAHMLALQSGAARVGEWVSEKRNVRADLQQAFGKDFAHIDAVAIMVDGDNTGQSATAGFGDIWFSAD
jgi:hypothetical protein